MPTYRNDGSVSVKIPDYAGVDVIVEPRRSIATYKILSAPFTKTNDSPYFPLVLVSIPAFSSPGTQTGLLACKVIRVTSESDGISVQANSAANPSVLQLIDGTAMDISNNGEIESLVFSGTGTVKIEGF